MGENIDNNQTQKEVFTIKSMGSDDIAKKGTSIQSHRAIEVDKLIPYRNHPFQIYTGERLNKLADSIRDNGLLSPIIVRPVKNKQGYYEILTGHNRVNAVKLLEYDMIDAIVKNNLTEEEAMQIVINSNLNQQSFSEWKYSQQIKIIKIHSRYIQENSQQGKRNDISKTADETSVHDGQKSMEKTKGRSRRDKMAEQLGISSSTFERYRSIAKLDDDTLDIISVMLDEKRLSFMAAYRISQLKLKEIETVMNFLKSNSGTVKAKTVNELYLKSKEQKADLAKKEITELLSRTE